MSPKNDEIWNSKSRPIQTSPRIKWWNPLSWGNNLKIYSHLDQHPQSAAYYGFCHHLGPTETLIYQLRFQFWISAVACLFPTIFQSIYLRYSILHIITLLVTAGNPLSSSFTKVCSVNPLYSGITPFFLLLISTTLRFLSSHLFAWYAKWHKTSRNGIWHPLPIHNKPYLSSSLAWPIHVLPPTTLRSNSTLRQSW